MGKKNRDLVHSAKRSWWDSSVTTDCGIKWNKQEGKEREAHFACVSCPDCKAAKKGKKR